MTARRAPRGEKKLAGAVHRRPQPEAGEMCGLEPQEVNKVLPSLSVPGHRVQVDVKFLTLKRKRGGSVRRYQYMAIDDSTRIRALKVYRRHTQANAIDFTNYVIEKFQLSRGTGELPQLRGQRSQAPIGMPDHRLGRPRQFGVPILVLASEGRSGDNARGFCLAVPNPRPASRSDYTVPAPAPGSGKP